MALYDGLGGLELQSHLGELGFTTVPPSELYVDEQRNDMAVELALTDLLTVKRPR